MVKSKKIHAFVANKNIMKKILSILFYLIPATAFLQPSTDATAPYYQNLGYPNIKLRLPDSTTIYTKENLPKDKTVVIIFFSPECEHCQAEATAMIEKKDSLQNLFMVWNANMVDDFSHVKEFYYKYGFDKFSNIVLGKEIDYYLPLFYRIENTPYAAVYKNGKLFAEFRNSLSLENLIAINYNTYKPIVDYSVYKPQPVVVEPQKPVKKKKKKRNR
jgi:thiol-disulfide isomerase/thioredoxin